MEGDGQGARQYVFHCGITLDGEGGVVALGKDGGSASFTAELRQDFDRVAGADEEAAAAGAQVGIERPQTVEEEGGAFVAGVGRGEQARVEDEDRQDLLGSGERGGEGLVIGEA